MPVDGHLSEKMQQELQENEQDLSILGIKKSNFNIDGILDHLTKKMIQHGPGIHKHLGRIKKHIDVLKKANLIDHDHLETIKGHVDTLHEHVGIIAANKNADHLSGLREAARNIVKNAAGLGNPKENSQEEGDHTDGELDLTKLQEMQEA